ncbi:uncharacterized protein LOC119449389 [Dermacentor silvarum]|uniref:uncharacterized protein LOC119449389 n=1 Tax=Dermacentor silvarum TaxID=543639 RepID=UPI0021018B72|nr:uncharacterized protein LOC119449389 [Dermacentor silvarum]
MSVPGREIFSLLTIATLEFLQENRECHPDASQFRNSTATISFMMMIAKWYALHDIGAVKAGGGEPFYTTDDEKLSWLELDFVCYLEDIYMQGGWSMRMTKETYEATLLTTRSTVALIEYLLDHIKSRYVLTRGLNSDPIESLFSCLRQFNGGNDRRDARTAVFTVEKLLKVGILQAARDGNAPLSSEMEAPGRLSVSDANTCTLPAAVESATTELSSELAYLTLRSQSEADLELAPVAFLAGYVARACEKKVPCKPWIALLQTSEATGPLHGLIKKMDNGGLTYLRMQVVGLCKLTCTFVQRVMKADDVRKSSKLCHLLTSALLPHLTHCGQFICERNDHAHTEELFKVFLKSC